ncbi:MAG: heavy metal-responsive transcriptional regulator [Acidimicrobiales bacterium]
MRIGELADAVGVNPKTIRFYEEIGLLPEPGRRPSGYRDYDDEDRERLVFVRTAQRLGLALSDIKEILGFAERGEAPCGYVRSVLARQAAELDQRIAELVALRGQLQALQRQAADLPPTAGCYCGVIEHAQALLPAADAAQGSGDTTTAATMRRSHRVRPRRP